MPRNIGEIKAIQAEIKKKGREIEKLKDDLADLQEEAKTTFGGTTVTFGGGGNMIRITRGAVGIGIPANEAKELAHWVHVHVGKSKEEKP